MKILVIGKDGQLSKCLQEITGKFPYEVLFTTKTDLDITKISLIESKISQYRSQVVINCAAFTEVDKAEEFKHEAFNLNSQAVRNLAKVCKKNSISLVHISTDYVFDGEGTGFYKESIPPNPSTTYGKSKLSGEKEIIKSNCQHLIIRTSWLFSQHGKNFLTTMIRLGLEKDKLKIVSDQFGCPTYAPDLAHAIFSSVKYFKEGENLGLYHYSGDTSCSWSNFAEEIFKEAYDYGIIKKIPIIEKVTSIDFVTPAKRPINSRLDSSLFQSTFKIKPSDWKQGIKKTLEARL